MFGASNITEGGRRAMTGPPPLHADQHGSARDEGSYAGQLGETLSASDPGPRRPGESG
jgi:hypothetical protein